jgi:demethylmenaquinone methyltransferase/2-methoxy-6-polyprenyl-1,4-benzoquinol methylase
VRALFDAMARRYEFVNHFFSLGIDAWWRRRTAQRLAPNVAGPLFDGAAGSAQLAVAVAQRYDGRDVVGVDFSRGMLDVGRGRIARAGLASRVQLLEGDLTGLPLGDAAFAGVTVAFGVRNVADRRACLHELRRILRPGGRLAILEFGWPTLPLLAPLYRWYFGRVMPVLGRRLHIGAAYGYLFDSVEAFPAPAVFLEMLREAGFANCRFEPLTLGIAALFTADAAT